LCGSGLPNGRVPRERYPFFFTFSLPVLGMLFCLPPPHFFRCEKAPLQRPQHPCFLAVRVLHDAPTSLLSPTFFTKGPLRSPVFALLPLLGLLIKQQPRTSWCNGCRPACVLLRVRDRFSSHSRVVTPPPPPPPSMGAFLSPKSSPLERSAASSLC